jgi:hypothetical protein
MKTKIILAGVLVAAISTLSLSSSVAQSIEQPQVKIVPAKTDDQIKVIYHYSSTDLVEIKFMDETGLFSTDKIKGNSYTQGFMRTYNVKRSHTEPFWVEVSSPELTATYKLTSDKNGRWISQLEKTTFNYAVVASR